MADAFESVKKTFTRISLPLPTNERKRNNPDCLVLNETVRLFKDLEFQTIRCPFLEGAPAFAGSKIRLQSHIQISVLDTDCILGVFRPNL